jgi:hypothetical protein
MEMTLENYLAEAGTFAGLAGVLAGFPSLRLYSCSPPVITESWQQRES